ncbi:RhoGAP domain containing protein [Drechmeria coniospora]|uniref:RhoGAP domain containing protein n=1 Tax=Drechmeria coniospora TaxID=98403 RepID=A0A151GS04_DRECN|nr:RhoGAP domain containing protein [Drechmeria coniospora]KYK59894.1 RhoGAP domain containing protein [Drechmeria coniospora]
MADFRPTPDDDALPLPPQPGNSSERPSYDKPAKHVAELDAPMDNSSSIKKGPEGPQSPPAAPVAQAPLKSQKEQPRPGADPVLAKQVNDVMASELGIPTLLSRLKQSIASAKPQEFALFLKKRSVLEDDHAQGLKKLCRQTQESARRPEHRQGSFGKSYDEMVTIHDRMAENGLQFAASLHQMHEDLVELAGGAERGRKSWKATGLAAEQKVSDLEQSMRKSKAKYDSLAEEYDRARTGEARPGGGKVLGAFKSHKSAAQQEEDLLKKVQAADQVYQGHVNALQTEKAHLLTSARPEAVKALQELINETDSGVTLQMQKFAAFNEKLLLGNGLIVSPFKKSEADVQGQPRSLRQAVAAIDNAKDLNEFMASQHGNVKPNVEVKYERNPLLKPPSSGMAQIHQPLNMHPPMGQAGGPQGFPQGGPQGGQQGGQQGNSQGSPQVSGFSSPPATRGQRSSIGNFGALAGSGVNAGAPPPNGPQDPARSPQLPHTRSISQGNTLNQHGASQQQFSPRSPPLPGSPPATGNGHVGAQGPPQLGSLPFQPSQLPSQQASNGQSGPPSQVSPGYKAGTGPTPPYAASAQPSQSVAPPSKPVYGVPLARLYERDGLAVPMVVHQCIQAVDLFGLGLEGIYRQSGSLTHINKLKAMFDADSSNASLDFRNPENFFHDVNSVTGLLKQFFRDLPDPILTMEHHDALIAAAKKEDDIVRRDSLHAIINALPDPNYATLRALTLHLYRVMDNSHVNRMNSHNLAVIFGPTLMGTDPSTAIADAGWQIKVIATILQNTYQIFDED